MNDNKPKISKGELEELYLGQKLPMSKLAERFDCAKNTIGYWMDFYGVKPRTTSEAVKLFVKDKKVDILKGELIDLYKNKRLLPSKIAEKYNCKLCTILDRLKEYGIKIRPSNGTKLKITKKELKDLYEKQKLSTFEIAERYNCCQATIWKRLDYWILQINKKIYLLKLLASLKPYIQHQAKIKALEVAIKNIKERNRKFGNINMDSSQMPVSL